MAFDTSVEGRRVRLLFTDDPYTTLKSGALGTALFYDDARKLWVEWDEGSSLSLIHNVDRWEFVTE